MCSNMENVVAAVGYKLKGGLGAVVRKRLYRMMILEKG